MVELSWLHAVLWQNLVTLRQELACTERQTNGVFETTHTEAKALAKLLKSLFSGQILWKIMIKQN